MLNFTNLVYNFTEYLYEYTNSRENIKNIHTKIQIWSKKRAFFNCSYTNLILTSVFNKHFTG